jgi:hypothetical protein
MAHAEMAALLAEAAGAAADLADEQQAEAERELERLVADYGDEWLVHRTYGADGRPRGWVATRSVDDDVAPTVHADTVVELERLMRSPGRRYGRVLPPAQRAALLAELADVDPSGSSC